MTAHAYEADKCRCLEAGFARHLSKPYEPETLIDLVAQVVALKTVPAQA